MKKFLLVVLAAVLFVSCANSNYEGYNHVYVMEGDIPVGNCSGTVLINGKGSGELGIATNGDVLTSKNKEVDIILLNGTMITLLPYSSIKLELR